MKKKLITHLITTIVREKEFEKTYADTLNNKSNVTIFSQLIIVHEIVDVFCFVFFG